MTDHTDLTQKKKQFKLSVDFSNQKTEENLKNKIAKCTEIILIKSIELISSSGYNALLYVKCIMNRAR